VRVDAQRHRDVVDLGVGEEALAVDFPGVLHLAAQRQDGLGVLVAGHLGAAAGGVALDQEELVERDVLGFAIGELARQHRHARRLALLDLLGGAGAGLGGLDGQLGELLAVIHVFVEPQLEGVAHHPRHQLHRVAAVEALLGLALEAGVEHPRREQEGGAPEGVVGGELDALGEQRVVVDEVLEGGEDAVAQAGLVGAAGRGGDEVDVGLAHRRALERPRHRPRCAFAGGEVVVALGGVFSPAKSGISGSSCSASDR
jgi:hypothetical protein